jgi:hypothetical protein
MAILSPKTIHAVLSESSPQAKVGKTSNAELGSLLEKHCLTPDDVLDQLRSTMVSGDSGSVRQRACETALKLNGLLDSDTQKSDFQVIINIIDPTYSDVNPILIPR